MKKMLLMFKNRLYLFMILTLSCCWQSAWAQSHKQTIKGVVLDARDKQPIPGAVIRLVGTTNAATATNLNGAYVLNPVVKDGTYTVTITFTGYKPFTKTVTLNQTEVTLNTSLSEDALGLNEVVVTGTAVATSKKQLGNAISTVSGKDLQKGAATSVDQALAGKVSGAQISQNSGNPAGGISVRLRGNSTIAGSSDPLYIIDGVIVNNSSDQLIDLGGYSQNRMVDINPSDIDRIEIIKGAAASAIYGSRASNGVVQIFTKKGKSGAPEVTISTQFRDNSIRKKLAYNTYPARFANTNVTDLTQVPVQRYDLQSMIFQNAIGSENNISVSGGSDNTQYYMSGSFLTNQGIVKNTDFQRGGGRLRIDQRFNNWIKVSLGMNYVLSGSREIPNGGINEAYGALTGFAFANNFINPAPDPVTGVYPSVAPSNILLRTNPLEAINRFNFTQKTSRFIGDFQVNMTPAKNLTINYTLGYDNSTQLANGFIPVNNTTPTYNTGYSRRADRLDLLLNNDLNVAYKAQLSPWLESSTGAGATAQTERINSSSITGTQLSPVSQVASSGATVNSIESRSTLNILGFYLQETLGFKNRLYLTGAIRNDVSSSFGVNNRWQYYPKLSASYLLSEENFWKNSSLANIIPTLKLRASYGQSGNLTAIGAYDRFSNYSSVSLAGLPGIIAPSQLGNADVKPERQTEKEIGMDASFLNDRLGFEVSYYNKAVKDLLLPVTLRPSSGYLTQYQNIGDMTNKGIELLIRGNPIQTSNFKWTSVIIFSKNKNKVFNIPGGVVTFPGGFGQVAAVNGYALGAFYATYFARNPDGSLLLTPGGLPQTEKAGRDASGQPTGAALSKVIGDPNPKWTGSFTNEFSIGKSWSFRMQWDASIGGKVFNFTKRVGDRDLYGGLAGYEAELKGEVPKGTSAALYPIMENWIEDGSYVKLRELSATYDLRLKFLKNKPLRISLSGRNLFSIDKYSGYDPETNAAGQSTAVRGFDFAEVPIPRTIALGLNYTL
ncbi:SusC/RagA family TonB-linked outer membrane protein [Pedobacter cryoconitis]|uniref:TonB-linked SusC/RagA family outer membrane protein n=1 Tax=Pedobacter cryoconitis TaxID=188932 RepID=A0A7X0J2D5_9SPHI|nr:SusC/RagA family TonB-linked outer membrane protein [Pedobacter cryoconitis]MBB6499162.1 TonB-linked SusC/RagA family outer membrane protein [Pedobacter cryoconitis]